MPVTPSGSSGPSQQDDRLIMGSVRTFTQERLIIGVLCSDSHLIGDLSSRLMQEFGPLQEVFGPFPFTYTDYYDREMGTPIERYFFVIEELVDPCRLSAIKRQTNELEQQYVKEGGRKVNLDPGLLSAHRFILATTKDRGHRIPLQEGIYGEVTLVYTNKEFQSLDWTYTDYRTPEYRSLLKDIRKSYLEQLKA